MDFTEKYSSTAIGTGSVSISDISPVEHIVGVQLQYHSKNLISSENIIKGSFDPVGGFLNGEHLLRTETPIKVVSGSTYTVSCDASYDLQYVYFYGENNEYISNIWMGRPKNHYYTFTVPNGAEFVSIGFEIDGASASTSVNLDDAKANSKIQLELGNTATEHEPNPYTFEGMKVTTCGKNLIHYPYLQIEQNDTLFSGGIDFTDLGDGRIRAVGTATRTVSLVLSKTISLVDSVTYSIKVTDTNKINVVVSYRDAAGVQNWWGQGAKRTWSRDYSVLDVYIQITSGAVIDTIIEPMICEGTDVNTPYEPYISAEYTANADGTVPGVKSIASVMNIFAEIPSVSIEATYYNQIYDGGVAARLATIAENVPKVYAAGQKSMIDESKIIEKTVSGRGSVYVNDVSEIPHEVEVKLSGPAGKNLFDFEKIVEHVLTNGVGFSVVTFNEKRCLRIVGAWAPPFDFPENFINCFHCSMYSEGDYHKSVMGFYFASNTHYLSAISSSDTSSAWRTRTVYSQGNSYLKQIQFYAGNDETSPIYIDLDSVMFEASTTPTGYEPYTEDFTGKKVTVYGANLLNEKEIAPVQINADGWTRYGWAFPNLPSGTYYLTINGNNSSHIVSYKIITSGVYGTYISPYTSTEVITLGEGQSLVIYLHETHSALPDDLHLQLSLCNVEYEPYVEPTDYISDADGVVVKSISPNMHVIVDGDITAKYHRSYGIDLEHSRFWDGILSGQNWQNKFTGSSWNDNTFYPHKDIKPTGTANNLFSLCEITDLVGRLRECGAVLDTSGITVRTDRMFSYATKLTTVPYLDVRNGNYAAGQLNGMFEYCYKLKTIEGIQIADDGSTKLGSGIFTRCDSLENVTFFGTIGGQDHVVFSYSPLLTHDSILGVLNALKDLTVEGTTQTLTLGATNLAKLTDGEKSIATEKGWTLA